MMEDFKKIMYNQFNDLYFEKQNFTVQYSEKEQAKHKKQLFNHGVEATEDMHKEKKMIEEMNIDSPENLPVFINNTEDNVKLKNKSNSKMMD